MCKEKSNQESNSNELYTVLSVVKIYWGVAEMEYAAEMVVRD